MRTEELAATPADATWPFDNTYARLPERFYASQAPVPVDAPYLLRLNVPLARQLGLDEEALSAPDGVAVLAGNSVPESASPLAMAYAGHQFGNFVPQLGDGRAILLGEVMDRDGVRRDVQLKGAGRTPFSRMGDGRAAMGPVLREYILSEAMAALGVPTTRSLAAVATGEPVLRDRVLPGAVLTRIARSHLRVGTFEYFAVRGDHDAVRTLMRYALERHDPDVDPGDDATAARTLIDRVAARQADLVARWMALGFIHGVMNTDNMSLAGETIDYGPCAFMDAFHPGTVYSSIDQGGRYAYGNQPRIAGWNLARLAETLLPLLAEDKDAAIAAAQEAIDAYPRLFDRAYRHRMFAKIGLSAQEEDDGALLEDLLQRMADNGVDFTLAFRRLCELPASDSSVDGPVRDLFDDPTAFDAWAARWRERLGREQRSDAERRAAMRGANPARIPRNHLVEEAIVAAEAGDIAPFHDLVDVLAQPYEDLPEGSPYGQPPRPDQVVRQTFCGT